MTAKANKQRQPRVYCESSVFIAIFKREQGRYEVSQKVIQDAREGRVQLFTSYCSIMECPKPHSQQPIKQNSPDLVEDFFENSYIIKCDADRVIAYAARRIQQEARNSLGVPKKVTPFDALHLATAMAMQVDYFFTYDSDDFFHWMDNL